MRTTVQIDDDIAAAIEDVRRERGLGLSEALNELARAGLRPKTQRQPFVQRTLQLGPARVDIANIGNVLAMLDEEALG